MDTKEKMFAEYEYLVSVTVHKMFANPRLHAQSKGLDYDDLIQYGRYGLWDACKNWEQKQIGIFRNFAIRNIRWSLGKCIPREEFNPHLYKYNGTTARNAKDKRITVVSMSHKPFGDEDETTFYDIVSSDNMNGANELVHDQVLSELEYNNIFSCLKPHEKEMVHMKMHGLNNKEIGDYYGISRQAIGVKFKQMQKKINRHRGVIA
jgi:RNA polymerase sigma factor (sigma-70 family)